MSKIVALIPARSGSKGIRDKNIRHLAGYPLLAYSINAAKRSKLVDRIIISTDSEHYAEIAKSYGAEVPFLRPKEISGDLSTDYTWVRHALDWFVKNEGVSPEYLVHLRPTTPLRDPHHIDLAMESILNNHQATALRSVHEMSETAYKTVEIENGRLKAVFTGSFDMDESNKPRQMFPATYITNGYVDVLRSSHILRTQRLHGNHVVAYITPSVNDIDTDEDFNYFDDLVNSDPAHVALLFQ